MNNELEQTKNYLMSHIKHLEYWLKYPPKYNIGRQLSYKDDRIVILDIHLDEPFYKYDILSTATGRKNQYIDEEELINNLND